MPLKPISDNPKGIRGIDPRLWKLFRDHAWVLGMPVGELLNRVLKKFLTDKRL